MRFFLKDILCVLLLGCVIVVPCEIWMSTRHHALKAQHDFLERYPSNVKTLILGHSQTAAGLDPAVLGDSAYNLSTSGRIIHFDALLLQRYIDRMENLQTVVYPAHYSFSGAMRFFTHKGNRESIVHDHVRHLHLFSHRYPLLGLMSYSEFLSGNIRLGNAEETLKKKPYHLAPDLETDPLGFAPLDGHADWRNEYDLIQTRQEEFSDDLATLARLCASRGIQFVVITCPFTDEALDKIAPEGMQNLQQAIGKVQKAYPDVEWFNYLADEQFRHDTSLFYDWSHLNRNGAVVFSRRVKEDLGF